MSVLKDRKTNRLFIQFNFQSRTYKKRLPENMTRKEAELIETKFKNSLFFEANGIEPKKSIIFEDFLCDYFLPFAVKHYTEDSYKNVLVICKCLLKFLKGKDIRKVVVADIERFRLYRKGLKTMRRTARMPGTIDREMNVVSKIFSYAVELEQLDFNPCKRLKKTAYDNIQDAVISPGEIERFLAAFVSPWARDVAKLILNTGLRQNDALNLKKFNVDWVTLTIRLWQGKTGRKVEIPMNDTVQNLLRARRRNGNELFFPSPKTGKAGKSIKRALAGASRRSGVEGMGTRILRRTFGTMLEEMNYTPSVVAKLLGHSDLRSVHRYNRGTAILRHAVEALDSAKSTKSKPMTENGGLKLVVND